MLSINLFSIFSGAVFALILLHFSSALINLDILYEIYLILVCIIFLIYLLFGVYKIYTAKYKNYLSLNKKYSIPFISIHLSHIHFKYKTLKKFYAPILFFIISFLIFFLYGTVLSINRLNSRLEANLYNKTHNLNIKITSIPIQKDYGWQFEADVKNSNLNIKHILVNIYNNSFGRFGKANGQRENQNNNLFQPKVGDEWSLPLKLKPPYANQNPYIFDYEFHLFHKNIHAIASADINKYYQDKIIKISNAKFLDTTLIEQIRANIQDKISIFIQNLKWKNVIIALVIGNQNQITSTEWELFNNSGIGHLISISGLHITMIAIFAASLPLIFIKIYPKILFYVNKKNICATFGLTLSGLYMLISGSQIPAQRTWIMLFILFIGHQRFGISTSLILAGLVIMLIDPWCVGSASFWLSFGAVGIMIFIGMRVTKIGTWKTNKFWLAARAQLAISLAMIPISVFIFAKFSLISPLANALAIPIVSYIISPLLIIASLLSFILQHNFIQYLFDISNYLINLVMLWCEYLTQFKFAYANTAVPSFLIFLFSLVGSFCLILPYKWRWYGIIMFIPLFFNKNTNILPNQALVTFFDVGQGSSVLISTANHNILFDTAPAMGNNITAEKTVIPSIQKFGINKLDKLIVSHSDKDHSGGLDSVVNNIKVDELLVGMDLNHELLNHTKVKYAHDIKISQCKPDTWEYDGVSFAMLYPLYDNDFAQKTNYNSCVLKIMAGNKSILLTADIEKPQEYILIDTYHELLKSDIMLAPHHGSKTSSTIDFLNAVKPNDIVVQAGFLNMYKHPHINILERYKDINSKVWRTDQDGAVQLILKPNNYSIKSYKLNYKRYWML